MFFLCKTTHFIHHVSTVQICDVAFCNANSLHKSPNRMVSCDNYIALWQYTICTCINLSIIFLNNTSYFVLMLKMKIKSASSSQLTTSMGRTSDRKKIRDNHKYRIYNMYVMHCDQLVKYDKILLISHPSENQISFLSVRHLTKWHFS